MSLLLQLPWPTLPPSWPAWNDSEINQTHMSWWWWEDYDISKQGVLVSHLFGQFTTIWDVGVVLAPLGHTVLHLKMVGLMTLIILMMTLMLTVWEGWQYQNPWKSCHCQGGEGADFLVDLILYRESNLKWQWTPKSDHKFNHSWQCQDFHGFWLINNDEKINSDESIWHFVHWYLFCTPQDQQWKWGSKYELDLPKKISWEKLN